VEASYWRWPRLSCNSNFLDYCIKRRILVAVLPPHSTHSLQPLDVVCFSPFVASYSKELSAHIFETQGLVPITKSDLFLFFWAAWTSPMTEKLILRSFEATGIFLIDREAVLKRFRSKTPRTPEEDNEHEPQSSPLVEADWRKIRRVVEQVVKDGKQRKALKISESFHHLQVTNELLREENDGLQNELKLKQKHKKKGKVLDLQQREEYHSSAVFWSSRKLKEARYREDVRLQEEEGDNLRKADEKHMREQAALLKKKQKEEKRVAAAAAKEAKEKEKERKAAEGAELQRKKKEEKEAASTQKALQLSQRGKRKASPKSKPKAKRVRVEQPAEGSGSGEAPATPPPTKNTKTCTVKLPARFLNTTKYLRCSVYYSTIKPCDNSYCGWLRSLMLWVGIRCWGGSPRRSAR
jgi:hypothetical protein